jgi:hypothetical protein
MLYSEIIAVCSQIHTKHVNALCEQSVEFFYAKTVGTGSNYWFLKAQCSDYLHRGTVLVNCQASAFYNDAVTRNRPHNVEW